MSAHSMQAIQVHQYGGPEQLKLEQIERPAPRAGEVLVQVHAAGVLPADWKARQGFFHAFRPATFPYIPGSAVAGVIVAVGPGVTNFALGQAVFGRTSRGAYAEYTIIEVETPALTPSTFSLLAPKPDELSFDEAAAISGGATTAWTALFDDGGLQAGERVLILGAAGGVGAFAAQFAHWKGAHVIGTTSTPNVEFVRALGANTVIDYTATALEDVGRNVDLVLDSIGGDTLQRAMHLVKPGGRVISLVEAPAQNIAQQPGIRATQNATLATSDLLRTIAALISAGQVKTTIARTFALHEAPQAHVLSQSGHGRGRIVLRIVS